METGGSGTGERKETIAGMVGSRRSSVEGRESAMGAGRCRWSSTTMELQRDPTALWQCDGWHRRIALEEKEAGAGCGGREAIKDRTG